MTIERTERRHDLLRVRPEGWDALLGADGGFGGLGGLAGDARRLVEGWAGRGWPVIVRRRAEGEDRRAIAVGLPLPPSLGKLRLGFRLPPEMVAERLSAVPLDEAVGSAPAHLRPQLDALAAFGARLDLRPAVFGALLWQHLTGLAYLHPGSDIDLIWPAPASADVPVLLDGLAGLDLAGPARIDGEILLAGGDGVNWRELRNALAGPDSRVLVKSMDGAALGCARALFA